MDALLAADDARRAAVSRGRQPARRAEDDQPLGRRRVARGPSGDPGPGQAAVRRGPRRRAGAGRGRRRAAAGPPGRPQHRRGRRPARRRGRLRHPRTGRHAPGRREARATTPRSAPSLKAIDTERGAKVSGARFYFLTGIGAELELALVNLAMEQARNAGFVPVIAPALVKPETMEGTGFLGAHAVRGLQAGRRRPLPRRDERGRPRRLPLQRDPRIAAAALRRLLVLLPARGRLVRQGHPRHHPRALVRQGRDVLLRPGRRGARGASAPARLGARVHGQARTGLPGHRRRGRRSGQQRRPQVRHRGVVPVAGRLPRADVHVELHDVPGPAAQHPPAHGVRAGTGRDAERHAVRGRPDDRLPARSPPAARRLGLRAAGAAPWLGGREVLVAP